MIHVSLRNILDRRGNHEFYLMHLSYGHVSDDPTRRRLWEYAKTNHLIGIDYTNPDVNQPWPNFPHSEKARISSTWHHQFELFSKMPKGACVLIAAGQTELLGLGRVEGPYDFQPKRKHFFRHVRSVTWLVAREWEKRVSLPLNLWLGGFRNTIQLINKNSRYWKITNFEFEIDQNLLSPRQGIETKESLKRKYGRGGEGYNHKKLKDRVFNHPEEIGLQHVIDRHSEYEFPSGDRADLVFDLAENRHAIVEIETDNLDLIKAGAFQALKYKVLKCAEIGSDIKSDKVQAILVASRDPDDPQFCRNYNIQFVKKTV